MDMHNVPILELNRSPAAQTVGKLASASGLFLTQFEHRHHLSTPPIWLPEDRPDLAGEVEWKNGVLKEHKYLHFRYDQPLGSFHPSHRSKWTTHELCHGLVGFTWRSDMTPLAHSLAARLSEVLPVALWYFFDEVQLRRCPLHYLQGALFQDHCVYCEQMATQGPRLPEIDDEEMVKAGIRFVKDELAMIAKSKRFGRPLPHRYATLDLNSDAMAYVAQNIKRMEDPTFRMFIELFHGHHTGMWADLDELEGRVWGLTEALSGGLPANPLPAGKAHWIAQDLGWRLLSISAQCEDKEAIDRLESLAEGLSQNPSDLQVVFSDYQDLYDTFFLPDPEGVFGLGYPLLDIENDVIWGSDLAQLYRGVDSACPSLSKVLGAEGLSEQISAFAVWDLERPQRIGVGKRFAQFLSETARGPLSDLATYEATLQHPNPPDPYSAAFAWHSSEGSLVRRAQGVDVLHLGVEVPALIEAIAAENDETDVPEREHWMLITNQAGGVRRVAEVTEKVAGALELLAEGPVELNILNLDEEDWDLLVDAGAVTPCNWHIYMPEVLPVPTMSTEGLLPDAFALTSSRGMWSQAKTFRDQKLEEEGGVGLEPAPLYEVESEKGFSSVPHAIEPELESNHADETLRSLQELNSVISEVRSGRTHAVKPKHLINRDHHSDRGWGKAAFVSPPQISSTEALEEMGYSDVRPATNRFEEQLRRALAAQNPEDPLAELKDHKPLEESLDFEELFTFDLEDSIDELLEDEAEFLKELGEGLGDHLDEPKMGEVIEEEEDRSGHDVGFGERWEDWDEK
jgi:hypothetical protein